MYLCIMFLKDALFLPTATVVTLTWNVLMHYVLKGCIVPTYSDSGYLNLE